MLNLYRSHDNGPPGEIDGDLAGTTLVALSAGFLCVISLLSTLRSPLVTSSPRLSCAKTAAAPPAGAAGLASGTGGGGGGGTEEGPEIEALYCAIVIPCKQKSYKEGKKMMFK
jgi:hypothetical protein